MYVRYAVRHQDLLAGTNSYSPYLGFNSGSVGDDHNLLLSLTRVWAFNLTSQSKVAFSRLANDQPLGGQGVVPGLYLLSNVPATLGGVHVALPGYLRTLRALPFHPADRRRCCSFSTITRC